MAWTTTSETAQTFQRFFLDGDIFSIGPNRGLWVQIDLQTGFFFSCWLSCMYLSERSNVERSVWPQEGGGSQAWRMCFKCQSCLKSSLSYPQVALWVQTSAAEWAPVLVRVMYSIFTIRVYVCCLNRQTEPLGLIQSFLVLG